MPLARLPRLLPLLGLTAVLATGCDRMLCGSTTVEMVYFEVPTGSATSPLDVPLKVGETRRLRARATLDPSQTDCPEDLYESFGNPEKFTFSSSNPAVATISTTGLVTAVEPGTAHMSVRSAGVDGRYPIRVIVSAP